MFNAGVTRIGEYIEQHLGVFVLVAGGGYGGVTSDLHPDVVVFQTCRNQCQSTADRRAE